MKTSLTKLIEWMDSRAITHESVRQKATELLEKEREQIEEYANQQPEVDHECKYCGAMTTEPDEYCYRNPNSKEKQPEQGEVTEKELWNEMFTEGGCVHCDQVKNIHQLCIDCVVKIGKSTLTQDKVREAAEKVVEVYRNAIQEEPINKTIEELEKALKKTNKMKTIAEQLNHDFKKGALYLYDSNGNEIYYENSYGYWEKCEYDTNGKIIYFESSAGFWSKSEYDTNGNKIYFEDSNGTIQDNRPKPSCEGKVVEIDGKTYKLVELNKNK